MDSIEKAIVDRGLYKRACDRREKERMMQVQEKIINMVKDKCDDGLVIKARRGIESETQNESSRSLNDTRVEGGVDQDAKQRDKRPLLASVNENKTIESLNQTFESENNCLKKTIAKLQKDFSKLEAQIKIKVHKDKIEIQNIELEHQVASLIKENGHLKLVYKNLFDSIKKPRVQKENLRSTLSKFAIDHILGKDDSSSSSIAESHISELEKESGESICENAKCELQIKIVKLEKTLAKQTKENSDLLMKIDNLVNAFADEVKRLTTRKLNAFDKENCDFVSKVTHLEKIIAQKIKDFDDVKLELSNRTTKFEAYFEKLKSTKVVLERQLARKVDDSKSEKDQFLKEINHLRTQLENLRGKSVETKFDKPSILGKAADKLLITSQLLKSWFTPKVVVQKDLSKPVTAHSLPKNEKDQLLKQIVYLESKFASQYLRSCQKEYHELRTSYNALKVKFDSLNRTKRKTNVSKFSKPKVSVSEKVHTGEFSKPFSKRVSQFTTYSLQKDRKSSKESQTFETPTTQKVLKKSTS
ncbi:hypothetical protein Tco_1419059, partial [Tanacetum coccineum]